jgi:uncharacterized protein
MPKSLAFDATARTIDKDGRMHIARSRIAKVGVNPYYGREIPQADILGLDPDKIYYLFRSAEELEKAAPTFARIQLLNAHVPVTTYDTMDEQEKKKLIVGCIGSDVEFEAPYLYADMCVWESAAMAGIETDTVRELSPAYYYKAVMISGEYNGQRYDGSMVDIKANHECLVETGRQGPDVLAADREIQMKITKFGKALIAAFTAASPKMALDSSFKPLLAEATRATFDKAGVRAKLIAMDAEMPPEQIDAVMDAMIDDEPEPKGKDKPAKDADDETDEEKKARVAKEKKAAEDEESDEKVKTAMDSFKASLREADEARRLVRPVVGEVIAQDTAAEIYGFALDHLKVDRKGVEGTASLRALFNLANTKSNTVEPRVAMDAAALTAKFPGATRFKQA